jgi:peptidyl-dipeptidase A
MWAQSWENLYPLLVPFPAEPKLDVNSEVKRRWDAGELDAAGMTRIAEGFFTSLGLEALPPTFWERSMLTKPEGKEAVCHASAWQLDFAQDVRIKMCILPDADNVYTLHHELGHIYYDLAYHPLTPILQGGANDGFHEGIGDTLALSITPAYLKQVGLLAEASETEQGQVNKLMADALQKIAFLPFGRVVDAWRWKVFSGEVPQDRWNAAWWEMRQQYQGIAPAVARTEAEFDPGAKYHVPANTPYMRYFLAHVLQFQFHEALCKAAGHQGPLHTCSIYGSKEAGQKLWAMMQLGASKPWPDALEAVAGTREMSAEPMVAYFQPLLTWLAKENEGRTCGW